MSKHEDLAYVIIERRPGNVATFLWGALLAAGATLLFAPRSGDETRRELGESIDELRDRARGTYREVHGTVNDTIHDVRRQVNEQVFAARRAVEAGRDVARETRADLGQRVREGQHAVHSEYDAARRPPRADGDAGE